MWVDIKVVVPPVREPVELEALKQQARLVDENAEDELLMRKITAAVDRCEGFTRRSLITQTLDIYYDGMTGVGLIENVPRGTVQSVVDIFCYDDSGVQTPVNHDDYSLIGNTIIFNSWAPYYRARLGIRVQIKSGFGDYPEDVPYSLREGILEYAAFLYDTRHGEPSGALTISDIKYSQQSQGLPPGVEDKWRRWQIHMV